MQSYDVVVVGGGPSGVMSAITIAKSGYKVILLDKKGYEKIGDKNCGDAIDMTHLNDLKDILNDPYPSLEKGEANSRIKRITIASGGIKNKISATQLDGYIVNRLKYGQKLLKNAEELGVEIRHSTSVKDIIVEGEQIVGVICSNREKGEYEIRGKIIIDASGYIGKIRKLIPDNIRGDIDLDLPDKYGIATYREIIELTNEHEFPEEIVWFYHDNVPVPGYLWIFTEGQRRLNIGITWPRDIPYPEGKSLKKLYHEFLDPYFNPKEYTVINAGGGNIPMRPMFDSLVFNGVILVGDAAAAVDPTTFEGHGPALESGRYAGKTAIRALEKNNVTQEGLWPYNCDFARYPGGTFAQSFVFSLLLREMGTENLSFLIKRGIVSEQDLIVIFQDPDQKIGLSAQIKKVIKAFPRLRLLIKLKKTLDLLDEVKAHYMEYPEKPNGLDTWIEKRNNLFVI